MNERQHIALTEAQIIAAEKGELQLETRDGKIVVQLVWLRLPYSQTDEDPLIAIVADGAMYNFSKSGAWSNNISNLDLFVSEQQEKPSEQASPNPLYEVGEIIEVKLGSAWVDAEHRDNRNGTVVFWINNNYESCCEGLHRKKQTEKTVTLENKVMTVKEAFKYLTNL